MENRANKSSSCNSLLNVYPINQAAYVFSIILLIRLSMSRLMRPTFNVHTVAMWKVRIFIVTNLNNLLWIWSQWFFFFPLLSSAPTFCSCVVCMWLLCMCKFAIQMSNGEMSSNDLACVKINLIQWRNIRMRFFLQRQQKQNIYFIWHEKKNNRK